MDKDFEKWTRFSIYAISICAVISLLAVQLANMNPYVSSWDQVDFTLAIERYDLRAMQPHFPGYPYFILGGILASALIEEPNKALVLFNILFYASSLLPIFLLSSRLVPRHVAMLIASVVYTASYPLIIVNQPMSEGAALSAFWWFFWSLAAVVERQDNKWILVPLFLFSVLLGIRLSYLPMGIGLLYLFYKKWTAGQIRILGLIKYAAAGAFFQLIWVGALILSEGGFFSFLELAFGFTGGHFQEWGGTASSNELPLPSRIRIFLLSNLFWWTIFSRTHVLMIIYIVIGILLFLPGRNERKLSDRPAFWLGSIMLMSYGIWALFAQNIDKPRHVLPIGLLLIFTVLVIFFQKEQKSFRIWLAILLVAIQTLGSAQFIKAQASERPAVYQLARYLEGKKDFVLYTWEETRVLEYMDMPYSHKRVFTYSVFQHDRSLYDGKTIYLTSSVVNGFQAQGIDIHDKIEKVKAFHSDRIFDPVYHDIVLYRWKP